MLDKIKKLFQHLKTKFPNCEIAMGLDEGNLIIQLIKSETEEICNITFTEEDLKLPYGKVVKIFENPELENLK